MNNTNLVSATFQVTPSVQPRSNRDLIAIKRRPGSLNSSLLNSRQVQVVLTAKQHVISTPAETVGKRVMSLANCFNYIGSFVEDVRSLIAMGSLTRATRNNFSKTLMGELSRRAQSDKKAKILFFRRLTSLVREQNIPFGVETTYISMDRKDGVISIPVLTFKVSYAPEGRPISYELNLSAIDLNLTSVGYLLSTQNNYTIDVIRQKVGAHTNEIQKIVQSILELQNITDVQIDRRLDEPLYTLRLMNQKNPGIDLIPIALFKVSACVLNRLKQFGSQATVTNKDLLQLQARRN